MSEYGFPVSLQCLRDRCRRSCKFVVFNENSPYVVSRARDEACKSGDQLLFFAVLSILVLVVFVKLCL